MPTTQPYPTNARPVDLAAPVNVVELPPYEAVVTELAEHIASTGCLAAILIDLSEISRIAISHGTRNYDRLMDLLGREVASIRRTVLHRDDVIALSDEAGDAFAIFLGPRDETELSLPNYCEQLAEHVQGAFNQRLASTQLRGLRGAARVVAGHSLVVHNHRVPIEMSLRRAVEEAQHVAGVNRLYQHARDRQRLQHIILEKDIRTVFQPILDLRSNEVHGYEALARGPRRTELESPLALFDLASKTNLVFELDQVCRRMSVQCAEQLESPRKLFINTLPFSIIDPQFRGKFLLDLLEQSELLPERIVLEVTETQAIEEYTAYLEEMQYFSDMGFQTGIDDLGTGYSGLERVVQLRPDYLKLDMHMVRDIDTSAVKQDIMGAFCTMAQKVGAAVVAEGVETKRELATVRKLGVDYVQGFYLARPADGFQNHIRVET